MRTMIDFVIAQLVQYKPEWSIPLKFFPISLFFHLSRKIFFSISGGKIFPSEEKTIKMGKNSRLQRKNFSAGEKVGKKKYLG